MNDAWIGVDLDGTLAHYDGWKGETHIGAPIKPMVARVEQWLKEGKKVKIFTARLDARNDHRTVKRAIWKWCYEHIGVVLEVTNTKDFGMIELWDDRAVSVEPNTGKVLTNGR